MARINSTRNSFNGALKAVVAAAVAIAGGVGIGILIADAHTAHPDVQVAQTQPAPTPVVPPTPVATPPSQIHPHTTNGDYTAPNAPRIDIEEEKTPSLTRVDRIASPAPQNVSLTAKPKDSEASQVAPPVNAPNLDQTTAPPPPDTSGIPTPPDAGSGSSSNPTTAPATTPSSSDPDYESVGKPGDSESSQQGDNGKPAFRVQTGAYSEEDSARSIANELRAKGYITSTRSERNGDQTIFHVQVGAYHTRAAANKAAQDLQKVGYPAYVSAIGQ